MTDERAPKTGTPQTQLEFVNQPPDREEPLEDLAQDMAGFIADDPRFAGKKVNLTFAHTGNASVVGILETNEGKTVLKIPSKTEYSVGEPIALKAWEAAGARVPHVFENGMIGKNPYLLMSFVDAKPVKESKNREERLAANSYRDMGALLRRMHRAKATGYGLVMENGEAQFPDFTSWLNSEKMHEDTTRVVGKGFIDTETIEKASNILAHYAAEHPESTFCHMDFGTHNVFDTKPLTVFDPGAELNISYVDVGKALVCNVQDGQEAIEQLIEGYEAGDKGVGIPPEKLDRKVLHAAFVISGLRKLVFYDKNPNRGDVPERLQLTLKYLADNRHLLGE